MSSAWPPKGAHAGLAQPAAGMHAGPVRAEPRSAAHGALPSIRARLSWALIGVSLAWGLAVSAVVWFTVQHEVDELLDNTLQEAAEILYGQLGLHAAQLPLHGGAMPAPPHEEHLVWQLVDRSHRVVLRSHRAPPEPLLPLGQSGFADAGSQWRVYGMAFDAEGRTLYVAQRGEERREARLEVAGWTAGGALLVGALCAAWLRSRVRHELHPLLRLSREVAQFDPLQPLAPLPAASRDELVPIRDAIAELGARLAQHLANERAFAAHAAHALRTPLAGMVAQLAVAQQRSNAEALPYLVKTRAAADRLRRVVAALLTLFRGGARARRQSVDLAALAGQLSFAELAVEFAERPGCVSVTHTDPDLLAGALMNLFDNAVRHGARRVVLCARRDAEGDHLRVSDDGSGLAEADRLRLQDALDAQHYEGQTGLGLMLADIVCRAHGGRLRLPQHDSEPGGAVFELWLGAAPGAEASAQPPASGGGAACGPA